MASQVQTRVVTEPASSADLLEVFGWLDRDPIVNAYLLALVLRDRLDSPRDEYWLARRGHALAGLLHLGGASGAVLPLAVDEQARAALAERAHERIGVVPRRFQAIGPRADVAAIVRRLERAGLAPRLHRAQLYMSVERDGLTAFERLPALRTARPEDYALVHATGAELRAEELEEDPRAIDPEGYARRVQDECREGYTWLWVEHGTLRFRASLSALTADAVQISGVYVPPDQRNRGHAQRGLAELCTRMFERTRAACLFVNDFNAPAIAVYRHLGFQDAAAWASAFYESPAT